MATARAFVAVNKESGGTAKSAVMASKSTRPDSQKSRQQPGGLMEKSLQMSMLPTPALAHESRMALRQTGQHHRGVAIRGRKTGKRKIDGELHVFDNVAARKRS